MGFLHTFKNSTGGYTTVQRKVRDATSDNIRDPWELEMREIASLTFEEGNVGQIMEVILRRLNDKGKRFRHIDKSLLLLNYLVRYGSSAVVDSVKHHRLLLETLIDYYYIDYGCEVAGQIRAISKAILVLIDDKFRLERVRHEAAQELKEWKRKSLEIAYLRLKHGEVSAVWMSANFY